MGYGLQIKASLKDNGLLSIALCKNEIIVEKSPEWA